MLLVCCSDLKGDIAPASRTDLDLSGAAHFGFAAWNARICKPLTLCASLSAQVGSCKLLCASCSAQVVLCKLLRASRSAQVAPRKWLCASCSAAAPKPKHNAISVLLQATCQAREDYEVEMGEHAPTVYLANQLAHFGADSLTQKTRHFKANSNAALQSQESD